MSVVDTGASIWAQLTERSKTSLTQTGRRPDAHLYVVGPRGSGKSTLLNKYIQPDRAEAPKPTEGLEYTYIRKPAANPTDPKDLAHLWEVSGSQELSQEILNSDAVLSPEQVATAVVAVIVDLSQPAQVLQSAVTNLQLVRANLQTSYGWLEQKGSATAPACQEPQAALAGIGTTPAAVAHTTHDTGTDAPYRARKLMAQSLRYVAHQNGASLVYLGGLKGSVGGSQSSISQKNAASDKAALASFRSMLSHMLFVGMDKRMKLRAEPQLDPLKPLMVPFGSDRFADIGTPKGVDIAGRGSQAAVEGWLAAAARTFMTISQAPSQAVRNVLETEQDLYAEPGIDNARAELDAQWKARRQKQSPQKIAALAGSCKASVTTRQQQARRRTGSSKEQQLS
ncbi:MAG: cytoplasmic dynein 2 light intermediate chain 1 [Trebouxia sp. A1-2]|nr:MAG: cytoplasmic dynein 2 light intermediate chain 1 [Trebouxia sp. A1-2]